MATTVDALTDQPTSLAVDGVSNHKFSFETTEAIEDGDTVTLFFPAEFGTDSITEDDIDVTIEGLEIATGPACGGEPLSISNSSGTITFTRCPGKGSVPIGSEIEVEIGANASAYGTGSNRITNPSTAGTYYIVLAGSSLNEGSLPLPIGTTSGGKTVALVLIGAAESTSGGGGGGGGGALGNIIRNILGGLGGDDDGGDGDTEPDVDPGDDDEVKDDAGSGETDGGTSGDGSTGEGDGGSGSGSGLGEDQPEPQPEEEVQGVVIEVDIFASPNLMLGGNAEGVDVLSGTPAIVVVDVQAAEQPSAVIVVIGDTEYVLSLNENGTFSGTIPTPSGDDVISAVAVFKDGTRESEYVGLNVVGGGVVYEVLEERRQPVQDVVLTVYSTTEGAEKAWNAAAYGQSNPILTSSGYFSWYVPNGVYVIYASKDGYQEARSVVRVTNNILAASIELQALVPVAEPVVDLPTPVVEAVKSVQEFLNTSEVETVADIALPATVAVAVGTVTTLAMGFNLLPYLQYLFTSPLLLFGRKRRKAYGVVYNAMTKVPLELAILRVYSVPGNRLVKSVVTSPEGRYSLAISPGRYRLEIIKSGFAFPSKYLNEVKQDGKFHDIYTGQEIEITDKDGLLAVNIPLDPSDADPYHAPRKLAFKRLARSLQLVSAPAGLLLSVIVCVINPTIFAGIMVFVQVITLLLVTRLAKPKHPKGWGIVADEVSKKPVGNVVIRLFEPKYNKLVETVLTDSLGRYSFLLGPNEYFASYNKPGYQEKIVRPIDYANKPEPTPWAINVALQHVSEESHVSAG